MGSEMCIRDSTGVFSRVQTFLSPVPEPVLGLGILAVAAVFVWATLSEQPFARWRRPRTTDDAPADDTDPTLPACHAPAGSTTSSDKD